MKLKQKHALDTSVYPSNGRCVSGDAGRETADVGTVDLRGGGCCWPTDRAGGGCMRSGPAVVASVVMAALEPARHDDADKIDMLLLLLTQVGNVLRSFGSLNCKL